MGEVFNLLRDRQGLFPLVEDRVVYFPQRRPVVVDNPEVKFIFYMQANVRLRIDDQPPLDVRSGDVLAMGNPGRQVYELASRRTEPRMHVLRIVINPAAVDASKQPRRPGAWPAGQDFVNTLAPFLDRPRLLPQALRAPRLAQLVAELRRELESRAEGHEMAAHAYCTLLLRTLTRESARIGPQLRESAHQRLWIVEHAKEFMLENYSQPLDLRTIADEVKRSPEHFCRLFKEIEGITPFRYLRGLRLDAAKARLASSHENISEIAGRVGFGSAIVFCRNFRAATGRSPQQFRREMAARIVQSPSRYLGDKRVK